jgi:hypothetical protein
MNEAGLARTRSELLTDSGKAVERDNLWMANEIAGIRVGLAMNVVQKDSVPGSVDAQTVGSSHSSLVGVTTAGTRALASQLFMFYLRVPVKLFRPTRVE